MAGVLNVNSAGTVNLYDPLTVGMKDGGAFTLNRSGSGTFNWGGANTFSAGGGSTINLNQGVNHLAKDFTATAEDNKNFSVYLGGTFGFDGARDKNTAMFTFSGGTDLLDFAAGTKMDVDLTSELLSTTYTYLLADKYDGANKAALDDMTFTTGGTISTLEVEGDKIYLTADYKTIYQDVIDQADPNTTSAIVSGALPGLFRTLTDEERAALTESSTTFNNATPAWFMNNLFVGQETIITGAKAAKKHGLRQAAPAARLVVSAGVDNAYASFDPIANIGVRFWSGYIGDFDRMDSHSRYYGYKSTRHGFVAGVNYDVAQRGSIGLYGGYTKTTTKSRGIRAEIKSDTGHVGVIGRLVPFLELPALSVYVDAGYTFSSDDSERGSGILKTTGDFETKFYTAALEVEYAARFGCAFVAPYASGRYVHLNLENLTERGPLAGGIEEVSDDAFVTHLGLTLGYDFRFGSSTVTPSLSAAWRHDFGDRQYSANAFYQGIGTPSPTVYRVQTTKFDRDSVDIGAAIQTRVDTPSGRQIGVNVGYNLNKSSNRDNHSVYAGVELTF